MSAEGIKHDDNKPRLAEMIVDFKEPLLSLCKVWEFGANKYSKSNWKLVDNGKDRYTNAMLRHLVQEDDKEEDDESGLLHASHIAFNALARLYFILQEKQLKPVDYINDFFECNKVDNSVAIDFGTDRWNKTLLNVDSDKAEIDRRCNEMIIKHFKDKKIERLD